MKVKNIIRVGDNKCESGSWLNFWRKSSSDTTVVYCSEKRCLKNTDLIGVHVQKASLEMKLISFNLFKNSKSVLDTNWYIIPMCQEHSKCNEELEVSDIVQFVPVYKNESHIINANSSLLRIRVIQRKIAIKSSSI